MNFQHFQNLRSLLLQVGLALLPVYVFSSGGVQPAHLVLMLFILSTILRFGLRFKSWDWHLLSLSVWVFLIESFHVIKNGVNSLVLINSLYFFYNFFIVFSIVLHVKKDGIKTVFNGVVIAAAISVVSLLMTGINLQVNGVTGRDAGTFNNPNQLGFFSVCLLAMTYFFHAIRHVPYIIAICLFGVALFLSILSLSKAAILANSMVLFLVMKPKHGRSKNIIYVLIFFCVMYYMYSLYLTDAFEQYRFFQRISNIMEEEDSSLESRGYFVFLDGSLFNILFGMGSFAIEDLIGHEVHSTFAGVLNNYGIVGLGFLVSAILIWAYRMYLYFGIIGLIAIVGPPILYGITHNGVRFVIFWVLFSTTIGYTEYIGFGKNHRSLL